MTGILFMNALLILLILVAIAWIGAGVFFGIWFAIRAACRRVGLQGRYQILIPSGVFGIPLLLWLVASVDRLDPLERTCRDELLKTTRMEGTTDVRIEEHYDFWTKTISGGGWVTPWISRPHELPKVSLKVNFARDQRPHSAWVNCVFSKLPNTGEPPQLAMQDVKFEYENVLEQASGNRPRWVPWHTPY
jgi:hypothetical protein